MFMQLNFYHGKIKEKSIKLQLHYVLTEKLEFGN